VVGAVSSLLRKLSRLESPRAAAVAPIPAPERTQALDDLRTRMQAVLARTAMRAPPPSRAVDTAELPFLTTETELGPLHLRVLRLPPSHRTGRASILPSRDASSSLLALLALDPSLASVEPSGALYLDTETTGLHGGTGTVAFLVGLARWQGSELVVEQVLVRNLGEEAPMLSHVAARMAEASMLVTFNGKSFDAPLLRTRFVMARLPAPPDLPHLDLVHVARRVHRARGVECRLVSIERDVLGFERQNDVPSGEVSACYLHFLRSGDASALLGVIEHNAWDVVAMAALVGLYGEPLATSTLTPDDLVGVARTLRRAGKMEEAFACADTAVARGAGHESLRARGDLAKARGDRAQALADYERLASAVDDPAARLELAKLYEHYVKEPARALALVAQGTTESEAQASRRSARLTRKAARASQAALPGVPAVTNVRRPR